MQFYKVTILYTPSEDLMKMISGKSNETQIIL